MTAAVGPYRLADGLPSHFLSVADVALIILRYNNSDREENTRRRQVGVDFDLGRRIALPQIVDHPIDVWPQALVGLPWDPSGDNEVTLRAPELRTHTQ